jgi:hypothetical protein
VLSLRKGLRKILLANQMDTNFLKIPLDEEAKKCMGKIVEKYELALM